MAKPGAELPDESRVLARAERLKWNRYTWSGLFAIAAGAVLIAIGLIIGTGAYSAEGLFVGIGALVILIGIIRILIGVINPLAPADLYPPVPSDDLPSDE